METCKSEQLRENSIFENKPQLAMNEFAAANNWLGDYLNVLPMPSIGFKWMITPLVSLRRCLLNLIGMQMRCQNVDTKVIHGLDCPKTIPSSTGTTWLIL
ncbi:hypothetical protein ACOME3_001977 [Neoechinorhynchus agilis]